MNETIVDGFRFSQGADGHRFLIIESNRLSECVEYCRANNIEGLHVSPYHGYHLPALDFLSRCEHVREVHLQGEFSNYDGLYALVNLNYLSAVFQHTIDLSRFGSLSTVFSDWNSELDGFLFKTTSLRSLWIRGYKPPSGTLERIGALPGLRHLHIVQSGIQTISGLLALGDLKHLSLSYCRRLQCIHADDITLDLEELEVENSKAQIAVESFGKLTRLRKLILLDCAPLSSLSFVKNIPALEFISFVNTEIRDGDMTPCFGLKYAGFLKKKHYTHTPEQVAAAIAEK